ncbi:hypothetical protein I308_100327 [Cryptococcus tetragattii IND107]|uniref:Uncharacterized protein n=1 Tax=Cryptococcus tetragattii IND107 TaxID=1296105 RepID=A0ABR3C4G9_9TREE|nr:hypothetical protein I308_00534 [Cryptococcus tetragattii IND107]
MPPLPFHLSTILRPLSPSLATARLKSNVFALVLFSLRNFFPPFRAVRSLVLQACDAAQGRVGREKSFGEVGLGLGEALMTLILVWNIIEAIVALQYPSTYVPPQPKGMELTPTKISSPLTRSYSPRPSTPSQAIPRQLYRPSPSSLNQVQQTPSAPSQAVARTALSNSTSTPLSSSTAKILNLPPTESPSNGLFYERSQERSQGTAGTSGTASMGGDFVLVDRDEKEWVDNVWKGVRGKAGRVGL